jgi:hypothetical protein
MKVIAVTKYHTGEGTAMAMKTNVNCLKRLLFLCLIALAGLCGAHILDDCAWAAGNIPGTLITPNIVNGPLPNAPIVFVSRQRLANWNGANVGPPVDVSGRELTPGGRLLLWKPDQSITDLTAGTGIFDVQQPDVSLAGDKVVFSAVTKAGAQWHIWEIGINGQGLQQLTFDDRSITIPNDPNDPGYNQKVFARYGDFSPRYLPDGRIMFVSTRYMTLSGSCGLRGQNIYVFDPVTGGMYRRTTERSGGIDPFVMRDGRIAFAHWVDAMNMPSLDGSGLRPLETDYSFAPPSFFGIWNMNPDGTGAGRYAFLRGGLTDGGGAHQPHELPNGNLIVSYRQKQSLVGDTLAGAVTIIIPGPTDLRTLSFLGDPVDLAAAHALSPAPLPNGQIVLSFTPSATITTDQNGIRSAAFDYGLYVTDQNLTNLTLVYNDPNTDELDAVPVITRSIPIIPDCPGADNITDDPSVDLSYTATMNNLNVYADLPVELAGFPSPRAGSVSWVEVYDDSQTFETSPEFPLLKRQMPRFLNRFPVAADGSFQATVPADRALLFVLTDNDGVAVRSPMSLTSPNGTEQTVTHSFNGHDYLRPGAVIQCTGCHKGHMFQPGLSFSAEANLARLAKASASSQINPFYNAAFRINDLRAGNSNGAFGWLSNQGKGSWVRLDWPASVQVDKILIYPMMLTNVRVTSSTLTLGDNTVFNLGPLPSDGSPTTISLSPPHSIDSLTLTASQASGKLVGYSEIVVNGPPSQVSLPNTPPPAPVNLAATSGVVNLTWERNATQSDEPMVAGCHVYYGTSSNTYGAPLDVGNVTSFTVPDVLVDGTTYYLRVKSYNVYGTESSTGSNEVQATVHAPKVLGIQPNRGVIGGGTPITITGENFSGTGIHVLLGAIEADQVTAVNSTAITAVTHDHAAGQVDVTVINPDNQTGTLIGGFTYVTVKNP